MLLTSCSLEKRHYNKGFYVSHRHAPSSSNASVVKENKNAVPSIRRQMEDVVIPSDKPDKQDIIASNDPKRTQYLKPGFYKLKNTDPACDTVVMRDGTEIKAKVLEISEVEVRYKYCDNPDGPLIVVDKDNVAMIKYSNGTRDYFKKRPAKQMQQRNAMQGPSYEDEYIRRKASNALVCGIVAFFTLYLGLILAILAVINGLKARRLIDANPNPYNVRFRNQAVTGYVLGIVYLSLIALIIIIAIALA